MNMGLSEKIANAKSSDWLCEGIADEEVIKIISEAKEQARERIKLIDTLNKIKAEILDEAEYAYADFDEYKEDILHADSDELPDDDFRYGLERAIEIIEKYKRESEDEQMTDRMTDKKFMQLCEDIVAEYVNNHLDKTDKIPYYEVYIVWYCKTLQNWKALVSTTLADGMYYELTLNGDKNEIYLDAYKKFSNEVIKL